MKDWKGNEIKPGMELCFIKIVDKPMFRIGYLIPLVAGVAHIEHMEDKRPDKPCWEVGNYFKVEGERLLVTGGDEEFKIVSPLHQVVLFTDMTTHILAIKGISDKQD